MSPRVVVAPADDAGCGHYRMRWPAQALIAQGADVEIRNNDASGIMAIWDRPWAGAVPPPMAQVVGAQPFDADVLVIQRPARRWWWEVIPHLQAHGTAVVVDVDDRMDRIHRDHIARASSQLHWHNADHLDKACRAADLVTATTPALLERYGYGHGVVLPNLVPESHLSIDVDRWPNTIGWAGFAAIHPGDLAVTHGAVQTVLDDDWHAAVVGPPEGIKAGLGLESTFLATGPLAFEDYFDAYAALEVAVVPLAESTFNEAKSALKMMEAASLGVPVVASPTPDNVRMHEAGIGLLAAGPGAWRRRLRSVVGSADLRAELAGRGREVMARYTYEGHADRWWAAWTLAAERRAVAVAA